MLYINPKTINFQSSNLHFTTFSSYKLISIIYISILHLQRLRTEINWKSVAETSQYLLNKEKTMRNKRRRSATHRPPAKYQIYVRLQTAGKEKIHTE